MIVANRILIVDDNVLHRVVVRGLSSPLLRHRALHGKTEKAKAILTGVSRQLNGWTSSLLGGEPPGLAHSPYVAGLDILISVLLLIVILI